MTIEIWKEKVSKIRTTPDGIKHRLKIAEGKNEYA